MSRRRSVRDRDRDWDRATSRVGWREEDIKRVGPGLKAQKEWRRRCGVITRVNDDAIRVWFTPFRFALRALSRSIMNHGTNGRTIDRML